MNSYQNIIEKYQKVPIKSFPYKIFESPVVSICVQTYQQKLFIRECLEGILAQETDFPYEILVGEDDSKDGTRKICIEYARKYPKKIRLFLHHRENNIEINGKPTGRFNLLYNLYEAKGKYIAFCEGDDYWTDTFKLQKQVDFLEQNKDVVICGTYMRKLINGKLIDWRFDSDIRYYTQKDFLLGNPLSTNTVVIRNMNLNIPKIDEYYSGVNIIWRELTKHGKAVILPFISAVYRIHSGGVYSSLTKEQAVINTIKDKHVYLKQNKDINTFWYISWGYIKSVLSMIKNSIYNREKLNMVILKLYSVGIMKAIKIYLGKV